MLAQSVASPQSVELIYVVLACQAHSSTRPATPFVLAVLSESLLLDTVLLFVWNVLPVPLPEQKPAKNAHNVLLVTTKIRSDRAFAKNAPQDSSLLHTVLLFVPRVLQDLSQRSLHPMLVFNVLLPSIPMPLLKLSVLPVSRVNIKNSPVKAHVLSVLKVLPIPMLERLPVSIVQWESTLPLLVISSALAVLRVRTPTNLVLPVASCVDLAHTTLVLERNNVKLVQRVVL
jgi:hypothetical protein